MIRMNIHTNASWQDKSTLSLLNHWKKTIQKLNIFLSSFFLCISLSDKGLIKAKHVSIYKRLFLIISFCLIPIHIWYASDPITFYLNMKSNSKQRQHNVHRYKMIIKNQDYQEKEEISYWTVLLEMSSTKALINYSRSQQIFPQIHPPLPPYMRKKTQTPQKVHLRHGYIGHQNIFSISRDESSSIS